MKSVVVFGVFDLFHKGHEAFLEQARQLGQVTAVLTQDHIVQELKGHLPKEPFTVRKEHLEACHSVTRVVGGDEQLGFYQVLKDLRPDIIALGYDQQGLKKDLTTWIKANAVSVELVTLSAFKPNQYKSSLMHL